MKTGTERVNELLEAYADAESDDEPSGESYVSLGDAIADDLDTPIRWRPIGEFECRDHSTFLFSEDGSPYFGHFDTEVGQFGRFVDQRYDARHPTHFCPLTPPEPTP